MTSTAKMAQYTSMSIGPKQAATKDLENYDHFCRRFTKQKELGSGADGNVVAWVDSYTNTVVAVKTPRSRGARKAISEEIDVLKDLGTHKNIAGMLASCKDFKPIGPAIFFEVCDLGDLRCYWFSWSTQQCTKDLSAQIKEMTVFKFIHDMILALDFLHNNNRCWVHTDLKPENILVVTPSHYTVGDVTALPTFKIADLGRMVEYPSTSKKHVSDICQWPGTFEFAPPISERLGPIKPAVDIWGLGATVQSFALGIIPVASRESIICDRMTRGRSHPDLDDHNAWGGDYWRAHREVVYRPLSATKEELEKHYGVDPRARDYENIVMHEPYSEVLNGYYEMLLEPDCNARVTAAHLKKYVVPLIEQHIRIEMHLGWAQECFVKQVEVLPLEIGGVVAEGISC